ncbi:type IV pili methyl-accepting chemotaxis transducer N-terminal domain-containing protein [Oceanobacter kriegii]|uniref:type IV pili methyl-accepting chemotaxis transducer N-terminal domain-containing protein n=1 Tax=Oceanobacter kriegii TaxID=64972 RepID=UPI000400DAD8|nr:type IV pili methyl-accepting chemotaxis transducer N-terminal domain-containing protein [Oceanobacter kriegii]
MRKSQMLCTLLAAGFSSTVLAETISDAEADYLSGHLCALSQRITKDYLAIGAGIRPEAMQADMQESMAVFSDELAQLQQYAVEHQLEQPLAELSQNWQAFTQRIAAEPELMHANAMSVINESNALLAKCNNTVDAVNHQSSSANADLIDMSEREAALTQRIARDYIAYYWKVPSEQVEQDLMASISQFDETLTALNNRGNTSAETRELLGQIQAQWNFSRRGLTLEENAQLVPVVINSTTNSIYTKMTALSKAYTKES